MLSQQYTISRVDLVFLMSDDSQQESLRAGKWPRDAARKAHRVTSRRASTFTSTLSTLTP